jgi:hypothetical protein
MRVIFPAIAAVSAFMATPALAADADAVRWADKLQDPATQADIAAMIQTMSAAMLDMPVAPLLRAKAEIEGTDPEEGDPDLTVSDLAGPEAETAPREIAVRLPQMMGALAVLAASFEQMLPQLRAMGDALAQADAANTGE